MRGMPFRLEGKGVLEAVVAAAAAAKAAEGEVLSAVAAEEKWKKEGSGEPTSVLDTRRSPSPPTSSSTLSSSLGGGGGGGDASGGVAAVSQKWTTTSPPPSELADGAGGGGGGKDNNEWGLEPIPAGLGIGGGGGVSAGEDCWESLLSASGASSPGHDPAYLRYFFHEVEAHPQQQYLLSLGGSSAVQDFDTSGGGGGGGNGALGFSGLIDQGFGFEPPPTPLSGFPMMGSTAKFPNNPVFPPLQIHQGMFCQDGLAAPPVEEKPPPPQLFMNPQQAQSCQNPTLFHPFPYTQQEQLVLPPPLKRLHTMEPSPQPQLSQAGVLPYSTNQRQAMKPKAAMAGVEENQQQQQQRQIVVDQLYKAAELVETGNSSSARGILARLNHQLSSSPNNSLLGKPLLRAAVLFKDALLHLIDHPSPAKGAAFTISPSAPVTPLDVVFKISAYKVFSEISPVAQFSMFTANQAILDELSVARHIHVLDFDIGIGGQWASFLQELSLRGTNSAVSLRITAFASPSSTHPLELALTKESLAHFAGDLGISFEFNVVNLDSFSPAMTVPIVSPDEVVAVNLPVGPLVTPAILRFVKQLGPRIVVSVDHGSVGGGGGGGELAFSNRFLHALQSHAALLDSINAAGADPEAARWIETFLVRPWIEAAVAMGRHRDIGDRPQHLPWRSLFALAGFAPAAVSNFTETQAECLIKRVQVREFHVEKPNASALVLCWQHVELVSVSAWRC